MKEPGVKRIVLFLVTAAALLLAAPSFASVPEDQPGQTKQVKRNPIMDRFERDHDKIEFLGNAYGMDGWIITNDKGGVQYVYTTPEGALLVGWLFAPDGSPETAKQLKAYKARTEGSQASAPGAEHSSSKSEMLYTETESTNWVALGDSHAPYIYIFMNVDCDHCQNFLKDLDASIKDGKIQARLIPYGTIEGNRNGGAALLSAEHPDAAWQAYVAGDKTALGKDKIKPGAYEKIDANTALVKKWKLQGPPFTLYRRPADGVLTAIAGRPENVMLLPAEFLALKETKP